MENIIKAWVLRFFCYVKSGNCATDIFNMRFDHHFNHQTTSLWYTETGFALVGTRQSVTIKKPAVINLQTFYDAFTWSNRLLVLISDISIVFWHTIIHRSLGKTATTLVLNTVIKNSESLQSLSLDFCMQWNKLKFKIKFDHTNSTIRWLSKI